MSTQDDALPEPVAWVDERSIHWLFDRRRRAGAHITTKLTAVKSLERPMPLYTAAQLRAAIAAERAKRFAVEEQANRAVSAVEKMVAELSTLREQLQAADHINAGLEAKLSQCGGDNCLGLVVGEVASWVTVAARDAAVAAERERCATICDQRAADLWHDYKDPGSPFRGDGRIEAMSDEAEECAKAIREGAIAATGEAK